MVDFKSLSLEKLSALVNRYPWFAAARKELCVRTGQYADAALYVFDRSILAEEDTDLAALPLRYPLIVKPVDAYSSKGVKKVRTPGELRVAFGEAQAIGRSPNVIVEEFFDFFARFFIDKGKDYRRRKPNDKAGDYFVKVSVDKDVSETVVRQIEKYQP